MFSLVLVIWTVTVAVILPPAQGYRISESSLKYEYKYYFKIIDGNRNGIAEFNEFQGFLQMLDHNGDGTITLNEYADSFGFSVSTMRPIFQAFDANHDDILNNSDIRSAMKMFDTDNNDQVTEDEFADEYYKLMLRILEQGTLPPGFY